MYLMGLQISYRILDAQSLKDKRSVVKSMINRLKGKYNISIAEVDANDVINQGIIGIGIVGSDQAFCNKVLDQVVRDIEEQYEIEIYEIESV